MKKVIMLCTASIMLAANAIAGDFHVLKQNGGANGYKTVEQSSDSKGNVDLKCSDPGSQACKATSGSTNPSTPKVADINDFILPFVDDQIASGRLSGTETVENYLVQWNSQDIYNYMLSVSVAQNN